MGDTDYSISRTYTPGLVSSDPREPSGYHVGPAKMGPWTDEDGNVVDMDVDMGKADYSAVAEIGSHTHNLSGHFHNGSNYWTRVKDNTAGDGGIGKVTVFPDIGGHPAPEWIYHKPYDGMSVISNIPLDKQVDKQEKKTVLTRRMVRVVVYDNDERVPDHQAVVYQSGLFCSSLPENELLLEMAADINEELERHNRLRAQLLDEKESNNQGREVFLRAIRLNDLEKQVINET